MPGISIHVVDVSRGPEWATADLFEGATWFLTPVAATDPDSYKVLHGFVSALGIDPSWLPRTFEGPEPKRPSRFRPRR